MTPPTRPEPFDPRDADPLRPSDDEYYPPFGSSDDGRLDAEREEQRLALLRDQPRPRRLGCSIWTLVALVLGAAFWIIVVLLIAALATPRSAPVLTAPRPGASGAIGSADVSARAQASASGPELSGAPHERVPWSQAGASESQARHDGGAPSAAAPPEPTARASGPVEQAVKRTAISSGWASWYPAAGDVASVPWWRPGQDPVWAAVDHFRDGRAFSVTVLIVGFCQCHVGESDERLIDLSRHAFAQLADPVLDGLVVVQVAIPTQGPVLPATDGRP